MDILLPQSSALLDLTRYTCIRAGIHIPYVMRNSMSQIFEHISRTVLQSRWLFWEDTSTVTSTAPASGLSSAFLECTVPEVANVLIDGEIVTIPTTGLQVFPFNYFVGGNWGTSINSNYKASCFYMRSLRFRDSASGQPVNAGDDVMCSPMLFTGGRLGYRSVYADRSASSTSEAAMVEGRHGISSSTQLSSGFAHTFIPPSEVATAWQGHFARVVTWCMRNPGVKLR
jgi:hypothetical protein